MNFLNRHLLRFSLVASAVALAFFYSVKAISATNIEHDPAPWLYLVYSIIVFATAVVFVRKEEGHVYLGVNYHVATFVITNGMPILLALVGFFPKVAITNVLWIMLFWGIFLVFHASAYWLFFRKKTIGNYLKEDVFS